MAAGKFGEWLAAEGLLRVEGWARDGLTDEQIAHNMGVAYSTFRVWKTKYMALSAVLKRGKDVPDREVENALFKRALGYKYSEVTKENVGGSLLVTKVVTKEIAPDTTAQIFWLKNRKPSVWGDRQDHAKGLPENNLSAAIENAVKEGFDDLQELQQAANPNADLVE